ncbi:CHRNN [Acanthosepion pharaonis]|uniref:CHRNN n=1 Tax=Acanthosepion pharaonis TaxID=158019 RepID=A0A812BID9_ACAPH|nr:CHRNN [Sepia pharaonis]
MLLCFWILYWNDYQLQWDVKDYGDISSIRIRPEHIWTPDVVLFNNADGNYEVSYKPNAVIDFGSNITWIPPAIYQSSCTIDVEYFPFDQQNFIIINRNYRTPRTHKMPNWVRVVFLYYLPKFLFMERPDHDERWQKKSKTPPQVEEVANPEQPRHYSAAARRADLLELHEIHHPNCKLNPKSTSTEYLRREPDGADHFTVSPHIIRASEAVKFITQHLKNEDEYETVLDDWKYIAMVLDRLLLYIFLAVTFGGTVGILMNAPHIFEYVDQDAIIAAIMKDNKNNTG